MDASPTDTPGLTLADHARRLNSRAPGGAHLPALILITDRRRLGDPMPAIRALPRGSAVILRDYDLKDREHLARTLCGLCHHLGHRLLVAGDARLAGRVGADGLHLPEIMAPRARRWRARRRHWLITVSAHSGAALAALSGRGADAALLGPVFATASHPGAPCLGPTRFAALVKTSPVPVYALGGISVDTAARLKGSGAVGIAAISGLAGPIGERSKS